MSPYVERPAAAPSTPDPSVSYVPIYGRGRAVGQDVTRTWTIHLDNKHDDNCTHVVAPSKALAAIVSTVHAYELLNGA